MRPAIKVGLVVGVIALLVNLVVAAAFGICGPFVALVAGALAGLFSSQRQMAASRGDGLRIGVTSGAIAGAMTLVGQIVGAVGALALFQFGGLKMPFGSVPPVGADPSLHAIYYLTGAGTGACFGIVGLILAAAAGAGAGYLAARPAVIEQPKP